MTMTRWGSAGAFLFAASLLWLGRDPACAAELKVTVDHIRPGKGAVRVVLYGDADSFRHEERARKVLSMPAATDSVTLDFQDLPAGTYAVMAYHDANDNKTLDLILGMFPDEGWGLSNDPSVIGPPSFKASAFDVTEPGNNINVHLHY